MDIVRTLDEIGTRIDTQTFVVEHATVTALTSADKEDKVVAGSKLRDARHAASHLSADGVERTERSNRGDVRGDIVDDEMELVERLRGLGIKEDVASEIELFHIIELLDDDSLAFGLTHKSQHFCMAVLAKDDNLGNWGIGLTRILT